MIGKRKTKEMFSTSNGEAPYTGGMLIDEMMLPIDELAYTKLERRMNRKVQKLKNLLKLATADCSESWQSWIHEQDCHGSEDAPEDCKCDGIYIANLIKKELKKV